MKTGANNSDVKMINYYFEQGATAEQISKKLRIKLSCIQSFEPEKAKETEKKTKARTKKSKEDHAKIMAAKKTPDIDPTAPRPEMSE